MLEMDVIELAHREWMVPIVFAPKKDWMLWFRMHYRKLNAVAVWDSYLILCMHECMDSLGNAMIFLEPDVNSGYWPVEDTDKDPDKTAFASHHGLFHLNRIYKTTVFCSVVTDVWELKDV